MPSPGEVLGGRYRLDDRIAAGGMGEVWRATDTVLGRDVAVKTLHADRAGDPGFQTRFRNEARAMAALHHPGVADVYDFGETSGADAYIVMARVDGEPLNQRLAERGRLSPAETMSVVSQAGRALEAAHQAGIVHRDVKPGNLIIEPDGTVVLVDFGVARSAGTATLTGVGEVVGTALYISPEQMTKDEVGPASDVYALGVVAYHCLAGEPPFTGDNPIAIAMQHVSEPPPELPAEVPPAVRAVVTTAMAKSPADRFPSAAAMAEAADRAADGGDTTAILAAGTYAAAAPAGSGFAGAAAPVPVGGGYLGAAAPAAVAPTAVAGRGRGRTLALAGAGAVVLAAAAAAAAMWLPDDTDAPNAPAPLTSAGASVGTGNAPVPASTSKRTSGTRPATTRPAPAGGTPSTSASAGPSDPGSAPPEDPGSSAPEVPPGGGGNGEPPTGGGEEPPTGGGEEPPPGGGEEEPGGGEEEPEENEGGGGQPVQP